MNAKTGTIAFSKVMMAVILLVFSAGALGRAGEPAQTAGQRQGSSQSQQPAASKPDGAKQALRDDGAGGIALNVLTNVKDNVNAQVVLLPRKQAERVFSKEIGRHYAVVQVTVNNKSKDAAFVLHSIFVDYSNWSLSGMSPNKGGACDQVADNSQGISCPGQVASVESRVIRGELQDASTWTWRNGLVRAAILVGTVGSALPAFHSTNAEKYVVAYTGQFIPGLQAFWPDATVPQLNRVSDFGFQTNKVIAKENSDIVYAFFPIDRFLTPGMRNIFLNAPALFFAPAQIFIDKHIGNCHKWKPGTCVSQTDVDYMKVLIEDLAAKFCWDDSDLSDVCPSAKQQQANKQQVQDNKQQEQDAKEQQQANKQQVQDNKQQEQDAKEQPQANKQQPQDKSPQARDEKMLALLHLHCSPREIAQLSAIGGSSGKLAKKCVFANQVQRIIESLSLNSVIVYVQGVMTVDVTTVPANITDVVFDKGNGSSETWQECVPQDAVITGRFLSGGIPDVTAIDLPDGTSAKNIDDYRDPSTISVVTDDSTDTKLHFKLQWKKPIPSGSKLHFQVTKFDLKDTKKANGVKSMEFLLPVTYVSKPTPCGDITVENGDAAATWKANSIITGNIPGSGLDGTAPAIVKVSLPGGKTAKKDDYIKPDTLKKDTTKPNDASTLYFTMTLQADVPSGTTLTFQLQKGSMNSTTQDYAVNFK